MDKEKDMHVSPSSARDSKNPMILEFFEKDNYSLFVYTKTERIVSALYLVSNLFPDKEPIRWQFRKGGVALISGLLSLTVKPISQADISSMIVPELLQLLSLLDISYTAGLVSEMNFSILKRELDNLLETLNFKGFSGQEYTNQFVTFNKDFFAVSRDHFISEDGVAGGAESRVAFFKEMDKSKKEDGVIYSWSDVLRIAGDKGHSKGHDSLKDKHQGFKSATGNMEPGSIAKGQNLNVSMAGNNRQAEILKLVRSKNNLTIRDFSLVIKGCSEKTIQRELLKLVKDGVLKKEGERRWSHYSLAVR